MSPVNDQRLQPWRAAWPSNEINDLEKRPGQKSAISGFEKGESIIIGGQSGTEGPDSKALYDTARSCGGSKIEWVCSEVGRIETLS